jgi:hypothetical protein
MLSSTEQNKFVMTFRNLLDSSTITGLGGKNVHCTETFRLLNFCILATTTVTCLHEMLEVYSEFEHRLVHLPVIIPYFMEGMYKTLLSPRFSRPNEPS